MKYLFILSLILLPAIVHAQNYHVLYRAHVANNNAAFEQNLQDKGITLNDFDNKKHPGEDSLKQAHFYEAIKAADDRMVFSGICTPAGQHFSVYIADTNTNHPVNREWNGYTYISHSYSRWYTSIIKERGGRIDTTHHLLDTAAMHMVATGATRTFGSRICHEYIPRSARHRYFSLWADATLPAWVHSCTFWGIGVEGGIVAITFKDQPHNIILESIEETTLPIPRISYYDTPGTPYLPFGKAIGPYQSLQLPD